MSKPLARVSLLVLLLGLSGCANTIGVAVKRGQQTIEPGQLPLVALSIATFDVPLPLDTLVFEDLQNHQEITAVVSKSFDATHPDLLTANAASGRSLSMPILHLPPGRYQIKSLEFVGPSSQSGTSSLVFDVSAQSRYWFEVQPGRVNYVGCLSIFANWGAILVPFVDPSAVSVTTKSSSFSCRYAIEWTAERDAKWAGDMVPGMKNLPSVSSRIEEN